MSDGRQNRSLKRAVIIRGGNLSDLVFALPVLQTLRAHYPNLRTLWIGEEWHADFLPRYVPGIQEVIGLSEWPAAHSSQAQVESTIPRQLLRKQFDLVLQLQGPDPVANHLAAALSARMKIGFTHTASSAHALTVAIPYLPYLHTTTQLLKALSPLGITHFELEPILQLVKKDFDDVPLSVRRQTKATKLAIIHPGGGSIQKRWTLKRFAAVADWLGEQQFSIIAVGGLEDIHFTQQIRRASSARIIDLTGVLPLPAVLALISRATIMVGSDTDLLHAASALGTTSVGLYAAPYFLSGAPLLANNQRVVVARTYSCPHCGRLLRTPDDCLPDPDGLCAHAVSLLEDITTEEVIEALNQMLGNAEKLPATTLKNFL